MMQTMITSAIPVIAVSDSARSEDYYCRVLGFEKMFDYPPDKSQPEPRYLGVARDGVWLHLQSFKPERAGMTDAFFWVADADRLHAEVALRGALRCFASHVAALPLRSMLAKVVMHLGA